MTSKTNQSNGEKKAPELSKSVGALVLNSRYHVLLLFQRKNRYWEFPKGKVEAGEQELDTLKREIFEETSIRRFRLVKDFRKPMYYDFRHKGRMIKRKVVYFLIRTTDHVKISKEHTRYAWVPLKKARKRLKHKNQIALIDEVITRLYG
ncbi:bis(5'-nucleosyl)-tetraphosphatase [Patescibacteria group bacterium]